MIIGKQTLNEKTIVEVDSDPRISIDENLDLSSLALWNDNGAAKVFLKEGLGNLDWRFFPRKIYDLRNQSVGGSSSNNANQLFSLNLSSLDDVKIGDAGLIYFFKFRGDFSATNEFIDVLFQSTTYTIGITGVDSSKIQSDINGLNQSIPFIVEDIGAGIAGLNFSISPSAAINFSPAGMPNGWWWELLVDIRVGL